MKLLWVAWIVLFVAWAFSAANNYQNERVIQVQSTSLAEARVAVEEARALVQRALAVCGDRMPSMPLPRHRSTKETR